MNDINKYQIWTKHLDGAALTDADSSELSSQAANDLKFANECMNDRCLHHTIQLIGESKEASKVFVDRCVERFESEFENSSAAESSPFEIQVETSKSAKNPDDTLQKIGKRKSLAKWSSVILAIATLIVLGLFVVVAQNVDLIGSKQDSPKTSEPIDGPEIVDSDDSLPSLPNKRGSSLTTPPQMADSNGLPDEAATTDKVISTEQDLLPDLPNRTPQVAENEGVNSSDTENPVFATIQTDANTKWESSVQADRTGTRKLNLVEGYAAITYDNQSTFVLSAPAKVNLVSPTEFSIESGWVQVECPEGKLKLKLTTRDAELGQMQDAQLHVQVDQRGTEVLLSNGKLELKRKGINSEANPLSLDSVELSHAFVNNTSHDDRSNPSFVVAHGREKYLGQVGIQNETFNANSPEEFEALLNDSNAEPNPQGNSNQLQQFNQLFRQIRDQFESGKNRGNSFMPPFKIPFDGSQFQSQRGKNSFNGIMDFQEMSEKFFRGNPAQNDDSK